MRNAPALAWSGQQNDIFTAVVDLAANIIVRARAGTGKTTTIVEAVRRWLKANPGKTVVVCAFNTRIARELRKKFGLLFDLSANLNDKDLDIALVTHGVVVKTLHAIGFAACRLYRDRLKIEDSKRVDILRKDALAIKVCGTTAPDTILRLVAKLHTLGRETAPHAKTIGDLTSIAIEHDCDPDESWSKMGFGLDYVERKALEAMELAANVQSGDTIDFADMIFLPCRNHWNVRQWDRVVVDEAQDMTTAQLEIAVGSVNLGGFVIVVGDDRQAIYAFRGADSDSLDRLKCELNATELGLTRTYRCGKAIVALAQEIVPDFEAGPANPEGVVRTLGFTKRFRSDSELPPHEDLPPSSWDEPNDETLVTAAGPGDFVLSRVNAPLVPIAMQLLRAGKRARVAGKNIGDGLIMTLRKLKARSVPELLGKIEAWYTREEIRQRAAMTKATNGRKKAIEAKIEEIKDKAEMLISLTDGAKSVDEVTARIEALFADDGLGDAGVITCSSIHKAKGLEANRVFVLADTLRNGTKEEDNLRYVAITRAKSELVWVHAEAAS